MAVGFWLDIWLRWHVTNVLVFLQHLAKELRVYCSLIFTFANPKFRRFVQKVLKMLRDFCAEVAVLVAVFPILETYVVQGGQQSAPLSQGVQQAAAQHLRSVAKGSLGLAFAFMVMAFVLAAIIITWGE